MASTHIKGPKVSINAISTGGSAPKKRAPTWCVSRRPRRWSLGGEIAPTWCVSRRPCAESRRRPGWSGRVYVRPLSYPEDIEEQADTDDTSRAQQHPQCPSVTPPCTLDTQPPSDHGPRRRQDRRQPPRHIPTAIRASHRTEVTGSYHFACVTAQMSAR